MNIFMNVGVCYWFRD